MIDFFLLFSLTESSSFCIIIQVTITIIKISEGYHGELETQPAESFN